MTLRSQENVGTWTKQKIITGNRQTQTFLSPTKTCENKTKWQPLYVRFQTRESTVRRLEKRANIQPHKMWVQLTDVTN